MSILFVGIFLTLLATCPAFQRLESVNRFHYGASFRHHGQLLNDVDTWTHTFEIRLPPLLFPQIPVGPCGNVTDFFCTFRSLLLTEFNRLSANVSQDVQATFRLIEQMLGREQPPPSSNSRSKRAPFSFVGDLANSLFDVATVSDVKKLKHHVDKLYSMQLSMTAGAIATTGKLSSFMKTSNERMNNLMETIATAHSNILNITKTIYRQDLRNYAIQRSVLSLVPVLLTKLQQVVRLERTLDTFLLGVNALLQRKLSPILIDHDTLTQALQMVQDTLDKNHPDFEVVHKQPRYYYHSANVLYAGQTEQILVIVEIPVASTATRFNLYHILTFPVPFNDSSLHGTRVTNLPDYVANSTDERYIIEISASQMALCHGRHMISCPDKFPHQALTEPSCAKAMFFKDRIQELCHFEFQESVIVPSVIELDEGHLLMTHISDLIFTCNRRVLKRPGCTFCMLVVPCFCSLLAGSFSFSPRLAACQERSDVSIVTNPGVNLALLQKFFNDSRLSTSNADKWYGSSLPYSIPPLHINTNKYEALTQKDHKLKMDLNSIANHMKQGKPVYRTALDAFLLTQMNNTDDSSWTLPHLLAYISFGLSLFLSFVLFVTCQKLRTVIALASTAGFPAVRGMYPPLTWIDPNAPTAPDTPDNPLTASTFKVTSITPVDHSIVGTQAFICLLLIVVLVIHFRLIIRSLRYTSEVYLEVCGTTRRVNVFLCSVAKCPGDYCIPTPSWLRTMTIIPIHWLWGELRLTWPYLTLKDKKTNQEVAIPRTIKLSIWETYQLRKIQKEDYTVFIKIKHGDTATYLKKPHLESTTLSPSLPRSPSAPQNDYLIPVTPDTSMYPSLKDHEPPDID